jgi:signal transduction histidine kinase
LTQLIVRESERVDRLVAQLLKFAKPSVVARAQIDLAALIEECVESVKTRADFQAKKILIETRLKGSLMVRGNRDEISEVITNLLVNAVQALEEQESAKARRLVVEGHRVKDHVEFMVADNGPGIPREFRSRVFDPFFTTKAAGTGLGLAQVHKIVREHDGQIDLETEEGKGTSLKIRLPG